MLRGNQPAENVEEVELKKGRVGGRRTTRAETRCGCFLPDLTGLARRPSAADLPGVVLARWGRQTTGVATGVLGKGRD